MLPIISTPINSLTLPVSGREIKYRPFLVKEQKAILQAVELKDESQITNTVESVMTSCTFHDIDINELVVVDFEYLLLNIRSASVGQLVDLLLTCENEVTKDSVLQSCNTKIKFGVNLNDAEVINVRTDYKIELTDSVGIIMKEISYGEWKAATAMSTKSEVGMALIRASIDSIYDGETVHSRTEFTDNELQDFLGALLPTDFNKIEDFAAIIPTIFYSREIKCPGCGHVETVQLEGIMDFLA